MAEDFEDLRRFLREEGIADGTALHEAEQDPRLAEAGDQALAQVLDRRRSRRSRRLVGAAAVAGVGIAAASVLFGGVLSPPTSTTPSMAQPAPAPLRFSSQPVSAGVSLSVLAEAAERDPVYSGSGPEPRSWYEWQASSPQNGELFVVVQRGDRLQVQSFLVPPPQGGQIDVDASLRGPAQLAPAGESGAITEGEIADVLVSAAGADCTSGEAVCALEGLVALRASANPAAVVSDAAAWRALATLPGVQATGLTTDRLGRSALGFTALERDSHQRLVILADPATGGFLGAEWTTAQNQLTRIIVDTPDTL